ncbi:TRAFAC clade GTPase domain-containing protein [Phenylobacterium montanum]|uniref:Double-GTPase 2 domain-containing protein n=1 Tax=Phenylobacterium montanum TaxID=2823693 RepID=A0A975G4E3_9CAUL|nr:hypothetical protein [Caulobacter sp. S6]QUD90589.1 hypothetical protein KCG34_12315 [Caulobacter sp. S6]
MSEASVLCANADCNIAIDGKCIEGLARETCPNFGRTPTADDDDGETLSTTIEPDSQPLEPSAVLEADSATRLLRERAGRRVGVIATFDAGKTSLIAAMYDVFQRGPVGGIGFAGSSTLHSFEVACHDSRSASRRPEASIFRTPRGDARFYHLDLCHEDRDEILTLLIADRAGEEYLQVGRQISNANPLFEVWRADTLTLLVDGARLIDPTQRHNVRAEIESIVQGLSEAGALSGVQRLAIALTKHDAVLASTRQASAIGDFDRLVASIRANFAPFFAEIETFITTASPKEPGGHRGEGLPELLLFWLKAPIVPEVPLVAPVGTRDFERLKELES